MHYILRYRIKYKISLLVFKCLNNIAPEYLSELIQLRVPKPQGLRLDSDQYLLNVPVLPQFRKTERAFSHCAPKIWNELPLYLLRSTCELNNFKTLLKSHYFGIAFE